MASPFDTLMASANTAIFAQFGQAATYTSSNGSPVACTVILDEGVELVMDPARLEHYGQVVNRVTTVSLMRAEIDSPKRDDEIVIDTKSYIVEGELKRDTDVVTVAVSHGE